MRNPLSRRWLLPLVALLVLAASLALLGGQMRSVSAGELVAGLRALPASRLLLALGLSGLGLLALTGVDALALLHLRVPRPWHRIAPASALGHAFAQALGSPALGRAPVRTRIWGAAGVEGPGIEGLLAFQAATFWLGVASVGGVALSVAPPSPGGLALLGPSLRVVGVVLVLATAAVLAWSAFAGGRAAPWGLPVPTLAMASAQVALASAHWILAGAALHLLLPPASAPPFLPFLGIFVLARALGFLSTVPQGLGVFEAVLLAALPDAAVGGPLVASLVAFRGVHYLAPLLLAAAGLGTHAALRRRAVVGETLTAVRSGVSSAVPLVLSGAVFVAGALLLATGALPASGGLGWAARLPLPVLEASHFLGSVAGATLLILSWGLARRLDGAFHATLALLAFGAVFAGLRGWGWGTATALVVVLVALLPARREFFRPSALTREPLSAEWTFGVLAVLAATTWLGFWAYRDVSLDAELWWRFALAGDAPRFLRGSVGAAAALLVFAGMRLLGPADPEGPGGGAAPAELDAIVEASPRPSARLAWLGDKRILVSKGKRAFIMYGVEGRSWISMGDPVGDPEDFDDLIWMFRSRTHRYGAWPVFYQVTPAHLPLYVDQGLSLVKLGEEAVVDVQAFGLEGGARAGMRKAVRKAEKDGASFRVVPRSQVGPALGRLREVSDAWMEAKDAREKGFSLGAFSEFYVARFPVAVVEVEGHIVAFANLWLGGDGEEYSLDLMRYDPAEAPDGIMQYLFARALLWGKEEGFTRFSLGMAPFSGLGSGPLAPLTARLGALVFRHGEHFYNFQGLRGFKEKFDPTWEPRYLASPGGFVLPRVVGNIATLVSGGVRGVLKR